MSEVVEPTLRMKKGDKEERYYNVNDSAKYTGLSITGFKYRIDRFNKEMKLKNEPEIEKLQFRGEGRQRFFKEQDLDRLMELVPASDWGDAEEAK